MGFLDFLGFTSSESNKPAANSSDPLSAGVPAPSFQKDNENTFPTAYIRSAKTHLNGAKTQIYFQITNSFSESIMLDKIRIFGTVRELDTSLRSGETRDFLVYDGPQLTREYHEIQLEYKTEKEGDYFQAVHDATFSYHPGDKTYTVSNITLHHPIRDI